MITIDDIYLPSWSFKQAITYPLSNELCKLVWEHTKLNKKTKHCINVAAKVNNYEMVKWLLTMPGVYIDKCIFNRLSHHHGISLDIYDLIYENTDIKIHHNAFTQSAKNGNLAACTWLHWHNAQIKITTIEQAIKQCHVDVCIFLNEIDAPGTDGLFNTVVISGNLSYCEYLISINTPVHPDAMAYAVEYGHLQILQWLYQIGAPFYPHELIQYVPDDNMAIAALVDYIIMSI